ncbi:MAG: hypothetical protein ACOYXC_19420 [Candidatus Rifleibacteriota bacterium]
MRLFRRKANAHFRHFSGCFVNERQILVGADLGHVERALEVLDLKRTAIAAHHPLLSAFSSVQEGASVILTWSGKNDQGKKADDQIHRLRGIQREMRKKDNEGKTH